MSDIFNGLTIFLISENLSDYMQLGTMSIVCGFVLYSFLSLFTYGITQVMRLFNI